MVIRRVSPMSAAKVSGVLGVLLGLVIGGCVSLFSLLLGSMWSAASTEEGAHAMPGAFAGMFVGVGAIVFFPIFYGVFMFIMGAIQAALYNLAAKWTGGLEVDAS